MTKKQQTDLSKAIDEFGEAYVAMCVEFVKAMKPLLEKMKDVREAAGVDPFREPEFRIVEQGAIPAAYYYRDSVQAALLDEIKRDYKSNGEIVPGVELLNGTTEKTSDSENDITSGGDGSEPPKDGANDGPQNGSSGASDPGGESKNTPETGTSEKTSGSK